MNVPGASSVLEMRRRSVWEAADSGILLWRMNFQQFIPFFAVPVWIAACALMLIPENFRWISWAALWWLKPFFDRLCLHVTAVRFFSRTADGGYSDAANDNPSPSGFRALKKGLGGMFRGLPGDLFWRRFSFIRSASMPLRLLEKPTKKQYDERKKILVSGGLNFCALLTCIGPLIEAVLLGGEFIFVRMFFELFFPGASWSLSVSTIDTSLFLFAAYGFNYILVESLYVCMGFGIYINCRTEVEGWDIQLLFQKFAGTASAGKTGSKPVPKAPLSKVILLCLGIFLFSFPLNADDEVPQTGSTEQAEGSEEDGPQINLPPDFMPTELIPYEDLEEILLSDDFGGTKPGWAIRLKNPGEPRPRPEFDYPEWLEKLKEILAFGLRALIVLIILGLSAFLIVKYLQIRHSGKKKERKNTHAYINPLLPTEDPETCFCNAEDFFRRGFQREAWASCLSGVIGSFDLFFGISFPPDSTEYGCLEIVRANFLGNIQNNPAEGFEELVRHWVFLAYGGRVPPEGGFEKAVSFGRSLKNREAELQLNSAEIENLSEAVHE